MENKFMKLPIDRLIVDRSNVRHGNEVAGLESLAASILAQGILQPIIVRPPQRSDEDLLGQRYRVTAGRRRFLAVSNLIEAGKIAADFLIPAVVREDTGDTAAVEISLAENVNREQMDPADEVVAFKALSDGGMSTADIAFRFGLTERLVEQRLALAGLHPDVFQAFAEGKLSLRAARAYTLGSQEQQFDHYATSPEWARTDDGHIKRAMVDRTVRGNSNLAETIGLERYLAAGGEVVSDLFGEETYWTSSEIVEQLRAEKIEEMKAQFLADGWSFCETEIEFGHAYYSSPRITGTWVTEYTEEQQAAVDEITARMEEIAEGDEDDEDLQREYRLLNWKLDDFERKARKATFSDEQKASSGVLIGAEFQIYPGVLREKQGEGEGEASKADKPAKDPLAPSAALKERLSGTLTLAIREGMLKDTDVAMAFLAAMLSPHANQYSGTRPGNISHGGHGRTNDERDFPAIFEDRLADTIEGNIARLVEYASAGVNVTDAFFGGQFGTKEEKRLAMRAALVKATKADPVAHFDAREFFASSSKTVIEKAMEEMGETLAPGKKDSLVNQAEAFAQRYGWLPWFLRFDSYALRKPTPDPKPKKPSGAADAPPKATDVTKGTGKAVAKPKGAKAIRVDEDAINVLAESRIEGFKLFLPGQLDRALYDKVNKVIKALGGKWVRHEGAHVFEDDVTDMVEEVVQTGVYSRTKQDFGQFDTPREIASLAVELAEIEEDDLVLEPSAGIGNIVAAVLAAGNVRVDAVEIDAKRAEKIQALDQDGKLSVFTEDFLESQLTEEGAVYDRVIMNPPFAGQADIDHVLHAWEFLKPGGILVAIMSASLNFRKNKKTTEFLDFLEQHEAAIDYLDEGAFKVSGTMVRTIIVKIRKPE